MASRATSAASASSPLKKPQINDEHGASILARLSFSSGPFQGDAVPEKIGLQDLPDVAHDARAQTLVRVFRRVEQRAGNASLWEKLARAFATPLIQQWLLALLKAFSQFAGIFFLHRLLEQLEGPVPYADGRGPWTQVFGLGFALTMETVTTNWLIWVTQMKLEMPVIALLNTLIFEKHMRRPLPHEAEQSPDQTRGGQTRDQQSASPSSLTDMISNDSSNVSQLCDYIHYFLIASFKLLFDVVYLSRSVGITSVLTGAASALVLLPLSARLSKRQQHQQQTLSIAHASVSNLISEALQGLRRIRLSSTERIWQRKIADARERELGRIWKSETTLAFLTLTANLGPILLASVALSVYAFRVGRLSPSVAFASLNLFRSLHEAFSELPLKAAAMSESWVSLQRIQRYLDGPEQTSSATASESIGFEGATLTWARGRNAEPSETTTCFRLRDVNLSFPKGKLSIITGKTGSGKSLLVASMLGEAVVQAGRLRRPVPTASGEKDVPTGVALAGETALVSQPPWIESCTIRDNIVFGYEFDEARYRQVIHACALGPDLSVLPSGDMTEAGVDGAVLSGGQKWRVALARALYSPARILILEDVLSAVDAPVARWIHEHALTGELARGRTRILVTHHPELCLAAASYVVVVEDGAAVGTGKTETRETAETATSNKKTSGKSEMPDQVPQTLEPLGGNPSTSEPAREILRQTVHRTKWQLLSAYVSAAGGARACILCALVAFGYQASSASHTWWLTRWTERQDVEGADVRLRIIVYLILSLGSGAVLVMQSLVFSHIGLAVSRALFGQMVNGILAAPLAWIDATPMGEVLHSLGGDMYEIDHRTSQVVIGILSTTLHLTSILLTNFISAPGTVLPGAFLLGLYSNVASHYFRLSQRLHKLIPASQRPMLEHASSAVTGLLTIRAFGKAKLHAERMRRFTDTDTKVGWHLVLNQRWLGTRLGALGALFVTAAAAAMVFQGAGAAEAGFVMTFALQLRVALGAMIGRLAATDRGFNAIDRMLNLTETPRETEQGQDAPECWPEEGAVRVDNVGVRYGSDLRPALKDISFSLKPRQRLGIVGRTGAGKTSLTSALLRFVDLSEGRILIDGRDIASLKLSALRSAVMLIPQDPFLFSGTLRANLDLGQDKTDAQLWSALRRVRLIPDNDAAEATAFADLSMEIRPGGDNLSHGQRQLVCLARALLARCRVLVLDEATSAVDGATDAAIQQVIRREFAYATILVVAHRLVTVADSDAILVLRDGEAAEFGSPAELMAREGEFWHMVRQSADADKMERMMMTRA